MASIKNGRNVLNRTKSVTAVIAWMLLLAGSVFAGSETPPKGPPWKRSFEAAQREALRTGKPMFVYFTKTY